MVYVLSKNGTPLMPTENHRAVRLLFRAVRLLLKQHKAIVVKRTPFTIRMLVTIHTYTQSITLGVDTGSKHVGMSATTKNKEAYASDTTLRNDVSRKLTERSEFRHSRRNRKIRHRKSRFNNRTHSQPKGWIAPSVEQKINSHLQLIKDVHKMLPITKIIIEVASFDIEKIQNPNIKGKDYQHGEQSGFWNVREYVLFRDGHECQCCHGKSKDKVLNVHHIESRKTGGNAPNNLITLCETCHKAYHAGTLELPKHIHRGMTFRDATFMGIMRWKLYDRLKEIYPNTYITYGYITKRIRIENGLNKSHAIDARCISGHPNAKPANMVYQQKCVRRHNRQLHKATIHKGGVRYAKQAPEYVYGFRLFDKVRYADQEWFIKSRRNRGYFTLQNIDNTQVIDSVSYKKLKFLEHSNTKLIATG